MYIPWLVRDNGTEQSSIFMRSLKKGEHVIFSVDVEVESVEDDGDGVKVNIAIPTNGEVRIDRAS